MVSQELVEKYLADLTAKTVEAYKKTSHGDSDNYRLGKAIESATLEAPHFALDKRIVLAVSESPQYQPMGVPITVGAPYDGAEVIIPVVGSWSLFKAFIGNRHICDGFSTERHGQVIIKQYDFARTGLDEVKSRIKHCVDSLIAELEGVEKMVVAHNENVKVAMRTAANELKQESEARQQKNRNADPWA